MDSPQCGPLSRQHVIDVLYLALLQVLLIASAFFFGSRLVMHDEPYRWMMAQDWARSPYFAPPDHIWPAGYFYLVGCYIKVFGAGFGTVKLLPVLFSVATVPAFYWLGLLLYPGSRFAAFLATLLSISGHIHTWLAVSLMAEPFSAFLVAWGACFLLHGLQQGLTRPMLLGAFLFGCSCSFRYEQWLMVGLLGLLMITLLPMKKITFKQLAGCGVLMSFYVFLWVGNSWRTTGDPFHFFHAEVGIAFQHEHPIQRAIEEIRMWEPLIFGVGLLCNVLCIILGRRWQRAFAIWVLLYGILFVLSFKVGTAVYIWRVIQGWRSLLVMMIPLPFVLGFDFIKNARASRAAKYIVAAMAFAFVLQQSQRAAHPVMWGFNNDTWGTGTYLMFERNNPEVFKEWLGEPRILFLSRGPESNDSFEHAIISYLSGGPTIPLDYQVNSEYDAIVTRVPEVAGFVEAKVFGSWRILVRDTGAQNP